MPILGRGSGRLLKTVNGKPHATEDDHISSDAATSIPLPTPPDSGRQSRSKRASQAREPAAAATSVTIDEDEQTVAVNEQKEDSDDPNRDPVSSDEEDMAGKKEGSMGFVAMKANALKEASPEQIKAKFKGAKRTAAAEEEPVKKIAFCKPSVTSADIVDPKKVLDDGDLDNDDPDFITNSQPTKKRAKTSNIHAAPRSSQINVFGREQAEKLRKKEEHERKKRKIKEQKEKEKKKFQVISLPAAGFKRHNLSGLQAGNTIAGAASCISSQDGASSPLSSLTPSPEPDPMGIVCETCHQRVDKLLKEEYDDDYVKGKSWNIQWQERFCEWHRTQTAKQEWEKRGYPEIKWTDLEHRMRRHDDSVLSVLRNQAKSRHRDDYGAKVKAKSMSSGFKDTAIKPGATVGYYGPKGEKAMSEHILSGLSDQIRQRAKTDRLVSPSGYQGGISGFVQGVLVPHLAELLIKEDMGFKGRDWETRVRDLIAESAEIGELVHPEVADRGKEVEG